MLTNLFFSIICQLGNNNISIIHEVIFRMKCVRQYFEIYKESTNMKPERIDNNNILITHGVIFRMKCVRQDFEIYNESTI